jgi:hypothetical protein
MSDLEQTTNFILKSRTVHVALFESHALLFFLLSPFASPWRK